MSLARATDVSRGFSQLGTSVAVPDRGDPVREPGELEASARDLLAVVELRRRPFPAELVGVDVP